MAELILTCILLFCSSSSGAQQLNDIKLSFNENKEVQRGARGKKQGSIQAADEFWKETQEAEKREVDVEGGRRREMWVSSATVASLKGQRWVLCKSLTTTPEG